MQNTFFQRLPSYSEFKSFKKVYPSPCLFRDANSEMLTMCSCQLQIFEKVSPRCLCEGVSPIITPSIDIGGWKTEFSFPRNQHRQCFTWVEGYKPTVCPYRNDIEIPV